MPLPETDFNKLNDKEAEKHPAFPSFKKAMFGRSYGHEPLNSAWAWFKAGWDDCAIQDGRQSQSRQHALFDLETRIKSRFPGIDIQVYMVRDRPVLYAKLPNRVQGVRVVLEGDHYEMDAMDVYDRTEFARRGNPSKRSPFAEEVIEFIEDLRT